MLPDITLGSSPIRTRFAQYETAVLRGTDSVLDIPRAVAAGDSLVAWGARRCVPAPLRRPDRSFALLDDGDAFDLDEQVREGEAVDHRERAGGERLLQVARAYAAVGVTVGGVGDQNDRLDDILQRGADPVTRRCAVTDSA